MDESRWQDSLAAELRQLQIIVGALMAGCVFFLAIALVMAGERAADADPPLITYVAIAFAVVSLVMRMIVPGVIVSTSRRKMLQETAPSDAAPADQTAEVRVFSRLFVTRTIIAAALIEGSAFFLLIAYILEQSPLSLIVAILLIVGLALAIPSRSRMVHWIEGQLLLAEQERQLGG